MTLDQQFSDAMGQLLGPDFPDQIGLAVSGGGDSMAMLTLAHNWSHRWGVRLWIATIDHGLRPESADEARMVARECETLGWPHATLRWQWDGQGNVMDAARNARLKVLDQWRGDLAHVLMGHTQDDVAETFLLRLGRGSGVDGLSAMKATRRVTNMGQNMPDVPADYDGDLPPRGHRNAGMLVRSGSYHILRPCLGMPRDALRHYLRTLKTPWVDDPTNDDQNYARARIRSVLAREGLDIPTLAATANQMARASVALRARAAQVWDEIGLPINLKVGDLQLDRAGFDATERETQLRLFAAACQFIANAPYRPRLASLENVLDRVLGGGGATLHGCELRAERDHISIFREFNAVQDQVGTVGRHECWDSRWRVFDNRLKGCDIRALGDAGWQHAKNKPKTAPPYHIARALPAIWDGEQLLACDALGLGSGQTTRLWPMGREFYSFKGFLLSH